MLLKSSPVLQKYLKQRRDKARVQPAKPNSRTGDTLKDTENSSHKKPLIQKLLEEQLAELQAKEDAELQAKEDAAIDERIRSFGVTPESKREQRAGRGRKKVIARTKVKNQRMHIILSEIEYRQIKKASAAIGISTSALLREALYKHPDFRAVIAQDLEEIRKR